MRAGSGTVQDGDVTDIEVDCTPVLVMPIYPAEGADWNDYLKGDGTDLACDPCSDSSCIHAGEKRAVEIPDATSCTGLSAADSIGAFSWVCEESSGDHDLNLPG